MELSVELSWAAMLDDAKLDEAAGEGITAISVPYEFIETTPKKMIKERAAALNARGIRVDTAHPRFGLYNSENSLVNQYKATRLKYIEQLKDGFERMSILGVRTAPLHTGGCCLPEAPDWALELCAESLRQILSAAEDAGIILAMENTFFYMPQRWDGGAKSDERPEETYDVVYDDIGKLCKLIDQMESKYVKGCYDAGHAHYLGDLKADHEMMGDRIVLYHIHDNSRDRDMHLPPGYGTLDWEALGPLVCGNELAQPAFIEAGPWMRGSNGHMVRETKALLTGGRRGEIRRCMKCGYMILYDENGKFCNCRE